MDQGEESVRQIRQIGFSYHGNSAMFCQLVDAYDWDFCQIQYNYMDEHSQAGVEGLRYANKKGLPVIIMEPLRGGRLVNLLPEPAKELFRKDEQHRTPAELALKWLYNQPEVTCVLSGMNSMEMVEQNVKTASESLVGCLTQSDQELIEKGKKMRLKKKCKKWDVQDVVTACHAQKEWIFRVHSAAIMRCIPKEKNREEEITCSVLHFEKIRAVHPSVFPVESVRRIARSILKSARS